MTTPVTSRRTCATKLLSEIVQLSSDFQRQLATELQVNETDLDAMRHLIRRGPLTPTELADALEISSASVTAVIDRLTALDHVHREPNPSDRRGVLVVPSPASAQQATSRIDPMTDALDDVLSRFTAEEQDTIIRYLEHIVARYREHAQPRG